MYYLLSSLLPSIDGPRMNLSYFGLSSPPILFQISTIPPHHCHSHPMSAKITRPAAMKSYFEKAGVQLSQINSMRKRKGSQKKLPFFYDKVA